MNEKVAIKSGYYFLLFDKNEIPKTLKKSDIKVELGEKIYDLYINCTIQKILNFLNCLFYIDFIPFTAFFL